MRRLWDCFLILAALCVLTAGGSPPAIADGEGVGEPAVIIRVSFTKAQLELISDGVVTSQYPVVLPRRQPPLPVYGTVTKVIVGASWYPTEKTREAYLKKHGVWLPAHIPPGDPLNAMGAGKILIDFTTPGVISTIRIHGNGQEDTIGTRVSRGCIRLRDADFLALASVIGNTPAVGIRFVE